MLERKRQMSYGRAEKNPPPCKDCTDRVLWCHEKCERYKKWKDKLKAKKKAEALMINPKHSHYFKELSRSNIASRSKRRYR